MCVYTELVLENIQIKITKVKIDMVKYKMIWCTPSEVPQTVLKMSHLARSAWYHRVIERAVVGGRFVLCVHTWYLEAVVTTPRKYSNKDTRVWFRSTCDVVI